LQALKTFCTHFAKFAMTVVTDFLHRFFVPKKKNFEQTFDEKMLCCLECFSRAKIGQKPNEFAKTLAGIGLYGASILAF
jgi:hypothetical protein